jgi:hypothetical protein
MPLVGISTGVPPSVTGSCTQEPSRDGGCGCATCRSLRPVLCRPSNKLPLFLIPCPLGLGIGLRASQKAFGPPAFHAVTNRQVSSRTFRPVMLAGLTGQPGSHFLSVTRRSWSSLEDSAALTASLPTFSRGQMKCLPDFRLMASLCDSHHSDNHLDFRHRSRL